MSDFSDLLLASTPRAYYPLGEASGMPQDLSGNALHMTSSEGTPTYGVPGIPGDPTRTAINFGGTSGFQAANHALWDVGDGPFTMEFWFKRNSATAATQTILLRAISNSYTLRMSTDHKIHLLKTNVADISGSTQAITDTTAWHCAIVTKNGASVVTIDIDGVEGHSAPTADVIADVDANIILGGSAASFPDMVLAHIAFYPTVLDPATRIAHYNAGITAPGSNVILPSWPRVRFNG